MDPNDKQPFLYDFDQIYMRTDDLEEVIKGLVNSEAIGPGKVFLENVAAIFGMLALPLFFYAQGTDKADWLMACIQARTKLYKSVGDTEDDTAREKVLSEAWNLYCEKRGDPKRSSALKDETRAMVQSSEQIQEVRNSFRSLLLVATAASWTSFETLATDLWVGVLNSHPVPLAQRAIGELPGLEDEGGLTRKQISIGLAAKHGFDLRNVMGDLLKPRFDFTSLTGIVKAYQTAFGDSDYFETTLDKQRLRELEWTRHVVVHRGGLVDSEFVRRANSPLNVGEQLVLDCPTVSEFINTAIMTGGEILKHIDNWLKERLSAA